MRNTNKTYTKRQILESIKYWKKVLESMDNANEDEFEQKVIGPNVDLSKLDNTVTRLIRDNMERFNECSTKEQVIELCHELFDDAGLDTAWTKRFFYYISQKKTYVDALQYVVNCYLKGAKLGVIGNRRMYEDETIHDDQVTEDTKLMLEVPGTDGASIEVNGDWDTVRFAVDLLTDALNHMKAKDPMHYKAVSLHVI